MQRFQNNRFWNLFFSVDSFERMTCIVCRKQGIMWLWKIRHLLLKTNLKNFLGNRESIWCMGKRTRSFMLERRSAWRTVSDSIFSRAGIGGPRLTRWWRISPGLSISWRIRNWKHWFWNAIWSRNTGQSTIRCLWMIRVIHLSKWQPAKHIQGLWWQGRWRRTSQSISALIPVWRR